MGEPSTITELAYAAYSRGDLDAFLRLMAPDCQVTFPGVQPMTGPEQVRPFLQAYLTAFPTGHHTVRRTIEQGSSVAVELTFNGQHNGPFETPAGALPPSGRQVMFDSVDIVEVMAGRITAWHVYLDTATMLSQLSPGLAAMPA